jgi:RNase H-fold protein (predicted Holliday junction resolvase)
VFDFGQARVGFAQSKDKTRLPVGKAVVAYEEEDSEEDFD